MSNFAQSDLLVFSHLRWDFVFQRPQQLMSRFARKRRVFFIEEPIIGDFKQAFLRLSQSEHNVHVATPCIPEGVTVEATQAALIKLIDTLLFQQEIEDFTSWYYTPMALSFTRHLKPKITIYDCMDELSAFKGAPPEIVLLEEELMKRADLIFTGGQSLYEAKRLHAPQTHCFPSSIDTAHFMQARSKRKSPSDMSPLPGKRIGFYGVIDERFDVVLLNDIAKLRSQWQFIILGPVVKIDPKSLPKRPNIHYLGLKSYQELPEYLSRWDLAILPFVRNEATRFISPTKTPEYLAAGCPVVSTSIRDVVRPYGQEELVQIADTPEEFISAAEKAMKLAEDASWLRRVDAFLADKSWDNTSDQMFLLEQQVRFKKFGRTSSAPFPLGDQHASNLNA